MPRCLASGSVLRELTSIASSPISWRARQMADSPVPAKYDFSRIFLLRLRAFGSVASACRRSLNQSQGSYRRARRNFTVREHKHISERRLEQLPQEVARTGRSHDHYWTLGIR